MKQINSAKSTRRFSLASCAFSCCSAEGSVGASVNVGEHISTDPREREGMGTEGNIGEHRFDARLLVQDYRVGGGEEKTSKVPPARRVSVNL